jgi:chemotaxis signal transduction protein
MLPSQALTGMARPAPLTEERVARSEAVRFGYRIGALNFLVGDGVLSEVLRAPAIYPIPNVPNALRGYVNRQGSLIPVWDIGEIVDCRVLDQSVEEQHSSIFRRQEELSVLLLGRDDDRVGLVIDGLPQTIRHVEKASRLPMLPAPLIGHVHDALFSDGELWLSLDHESFFAAQASDVASGGALVSAA